MNEEFPVGWDPKDEVLLNPVIKSLVIQCKCGLDCALEQTADWTHGGLCSCGRWNYLSIDDIVGQSYLSKQ